MKNFLKLFFVALCMLLCIIPSVGMIFNPTTQAIGNEQMTALPEIKTEDGAFNVHYFTELGSYFETHFAYRPQVITADATIQASVFNVSNLDSVIVGSDGYLYYSSSVNDYLGKDTLNNRQINSVIHNLSIVQDYTNSCNVDFLFTIAPNKNTLYPDYMPYYYKQKVSGTHNRDLFNKSVQNSDLNYLNLFDVFENKNEVLYFKRDSHWNNKGALLAYNSIMDTTGKSYDDYSTASVSRRKDFVGDLSLMLYPTSDSAEYNYYYGTEDRYSYVTDTKSVEDAIITTKCTDATGSLYMYRDSFGNALLPFFATAYEDATFTKAFPMMLENDLQLYSPDIFIMELCERNLNWLILRPPVLSSPTLSLYTISENLDKEIKVSASACEYSPMYTQFYGEIPNEYLTDTSVIYIDVTDENSNTTTYECYDIMTDSQNSSFLAYVPAQKYKGQNKLSVSVIIKDDSKFTMLSKTEVTLN